MVTFSKTFLFMLKKEMYSLTNQSTKETPAGSSAVIMINHMADGWCIQLHLKLEGSWVSEAHDRRPVPCTVASVIAELVKWPGEVTLSSLCLLGPTLRCFPYGAGCRSVRRTAHSAPSPAALPAPSACLTAQHGSGNGEIGHQHNNGRRRVQ